MPPATPAEVETYFARRAKQGKFPLKQYAVARYTAEGWSRAAIAAELGISVETVKVHRARMRKGLGAFNSRALASGSTDPR